MTAYYNEIDAYAAQWLRNLIAAGHLPAGDVDERSISEVSPDDLLGYTQVHLFAGLGGWAYAARLVGWPDDRPIWTGSCPCQPYSQAGKGLGDADPRNLWPAMHRLIAECRPDCVIGEQVASAIGHGWLDGISADLEAEDYAVGAVVLGAHSVGAPHIRQRLFWVAESGRASDERLLRSGEAPGPAGAIEGETWERERRGPDAGRGGAALGLADGQGDGWREGGAVASRSAEGTRTEGAGRGPADDCGGSGLDNPLRDGRGAGRHADPRHDGNLAHAAGGLGSGMDHPDGARRTPAGIGPEGEARDETRLRRPEPGCADGGLGDADREGSFPRRTTTEADGFRGPAVAAGSPWDDAVWLPCADGKARRIEPGLEPLVDGVPNRVGRLRAYGNAIVPQLAAEFLTAYVETLSLAQEAA